MRSYGISDFEVVSCNHMGSVTSELRSYQISHLGVVSPGKM